MELLLPIRLKWEEVQRLMELRNIPSRAELARMAKISESALYKISKEHFQPSMDSIGRLCQVLNCQPGDLLYYVEEEPEDLT